MARLQSFFGPAAGQESARPEALARKSRFFPPQTSQSSATGLASVAPFTGPPSAAALRPLSATTGTAITHTSRTNEEKCMISLDAREGEMFHCLPAASAGLARGPNPK